MPRPRRRRSPFRSLRGRQGARLLDRPLRPARPFLVAVVGFVALGLLLTTAPSWFGQRWGHDYSKVVLLIWSVVYWGSYDLWAERRYGPRTVEDMLLASSLLWRRQPDAGGLVVQHGNCRMLLVADPRGPDGPWFRWTVVSDEASDETDLSYWPEGWAVADEPAYRPDRWSLR